MGDTEIADTYTPVEIKGQISGGSRTRVQVRGEPVVSSFLETFPDGRKVASREMDEIHVHLLQS